MIWGILGYHYFWKHPHVIHRGPSDPAVQDDELTANKMIFDNAGNAGPRCRHTDIHTLVSVVCLCCLLFVVCCVLFVVCCLLCVVCCLLFVVCCLFVCLFVCCCCCGVCCLLFVVCCWLLVVGCWWLVVCCLLFVVCCVLFVVCCVLSLSLSLSLLLLSWLFFVIDPWISNSVTTKRFTGTNYMAETPSAV